MKKAKYNFECPTCNKTAFSLTEKPVNGECLKIETVIHTGNPSYMDFVKCQQCKEHVSFKGHIWPPNLIHKKK